MKKLMFIAMMMVAMSASAQREVGTLTLQPKIGISSPIMYMDDKNVDNQSMTGFVGGAELEYQMKKWFSLSAGVMYSQEGGKNKIKDLNVTEKVNLGYINIPVMANFYVWKGLALKIGLQPGFKVHEKFDVPNNAALSTSKYGFGNKADNFDLKLPIGISYDFGNVVLELRSAPGLTKPLKDKDYINGCAQLTVGYKFKLN